MSLSPSLQKLVDTVKPTTHELIAVSYNITRMREERGWSKRELARRMGKSHPQIVRWEEPVPSMTLDSLQDIADIFGVTMASMFIDGRE